MNALRKGAIVTSCATLFIVWAAVASNPAKAAIITLSHFSSDKTPAAVLDARLIFSTLGNFMRLDVYNETADPDAYRINQIYFNATENVTGLELLEWEPDPPPPGWTLLTDEPAGDFGVFDFCLDGGIGNDPNLLQPGEDYSFRFGISGTAPFFDTDFVTFSTIPPGDTMALAAAKFIGGPADNDPDEDDEDGAIGAAVPIPGAVWLLGSGLIGLAVMRRKNRLNKLNGAPQI
jgi:hypothetical protein